MSMKSPRGVQQADVNAAADELLMEQLKPTIERVRLKLGRGSPNTVGPMLDEWFASLGPRLVGTPGGVDEATTLPPVLQTAMQSLWKSALEEANTTFEASKAELLLRQSQHEERLNRERAEIDTERRTFSQEAAANRQAIAQLQSQLAEAKNQANQLLLSIQQKDEELKNSRETLQHHLVSSNEQRRRQDEQLRMHGSEILALQTQYSQSERRLMTEIDRERQQVKKLQMELEAQKRNHEVQKNESLQLLANLTSQLNEAHVHINGLTGRMAGYLSNIHDLQTSIVKGQVKKYPGTRFRIQKANRET